MLFTFFFTKKLLKLPSVTAFVHILPLLTCLHLLPSFFSLLSPLCLDCDCLRVVYCLLLYKATIYINCTIELQAAL